MHVILPVIVISILAASHNIDTNLNTILASLTSKYGEWKTIMAEEDLRRGAGVVSGGGGPNTLPGWLSGIGVCSACKLHWDAEVTFIGLDIIGVRGVVSPPLGAGIPLFVVPCALQEGLRTRGGDLRAMGHIFLLWRFLL